MKTKRWRVDAVPLWAAPFFSLYATAGGAALWKWIRAMNRHCEIELRGESELARTPHILCAWHEHWVSFWITHPYFKHHAWMNDPSWYMKPIHVAMCDAGVERVHLGSTGDGGRKAADELVSSLKAGFSTLILPDGPWWTPSAPSHVGREMAPASWRQTGARVWCADYDRKRPRRDHAWSHRIDRRITLKSSASLDFWFPSRFAQIPMTTHHANGTQIDEPTGARRLIASGTRTRRAV